MEKIRVTKSNPCPICGKPDFCVVYPEERQVLCMRVQSSNPLKSSKLGGGWFHSLDSTVEIKRPAKTKTARIPLQHMPRLAESYRLKVNEDALRIYAKSKGVSVDSYKRMEIGFDGKCWAFPMRNGNDVIVGIRLESPSGDRFCVKGSHNGLFWPQDVSALTDGLLMVCEGYSDCAALLDMGFDAVGRSQCNAGPDDIIQLLSKCRREVIVVSDHDSPKTRPDGSVWLPGQEGAYQLAKQIKRHTRRISLFLPPTAKDVRQWVREGCNRDLFLAVHRNQAKFL